LPGVASFAYYGRGLFSLNMTKIIVCHVKHRIFTCFLERLFIVYDKYYLCLMKSEDAKPKRKPLLSIECESKEQKELFNRIAKRRGVTTAALVRLLLLDEARRLGIE
jgi:hypothetical protein